MISSTKDGARSRRRTRAAISTAAALVAAAALAGPASADLTAAPNDATGFPASVTDALGQVALICFGPAAPCGGGPTPSEIVQPDGEGFYWSGAVSVPMADGDIDIAWDAEAATGPDGVQTTFQRVQIGSRVDSGTLPNGDYTVTSPYGTFTATKTATSRPNNWLRIESSSVAIGPIDHFLVSAAAPAGYYGDGNADPGPIVGGATAGTVTVAGPTGDIGVTADWTITGRMDGTPIPPPPPPADGDGDGVPNNVDGCPSVAGPASNNGCPAPPAPPQPPAKASAGTAAAPPASTTTIVQVVQPSQQVQGVTASSPLAVSRLTLARRISISRLRSRGLRATMNVQQGTNVVRIAIYKARNGQKRGRALYTTTRTPTKAGLFRVSLRSAKLAKLKPGAYVMEVRAGSSAASLGPVRRIAFRVTR